MNAGTQSSRRTMLRGVGCVGVALGLTIAIFAAIPSAEEAASSDGFISGVVESSTGVEAGVWVIAETEELETKFAKIVVTDDAGRFVIPELPDVTYDVWVRGYGLVDSEKVKLSPSSNEVKLAGVVAPNELSLLRHMSFPVLALMAMESRLR